MQKLPYKDFEYTQTSLDEIMKIPDDKNHGYYIVCDFDYNDICEDRRQQLALMPNRRKIIDNDLGYRKREKGRARTEKLILDQNNKTESIVHYRMLKFYIKIGVKVISKE